jgi:uncharacterized cupin superfamily protein
MVLRGLQRGVRLYAKVRYGLRSRLVVATMPGLETALEAQPIPSDWVEEGTPEASARIFATSPDGGLVVGAWHCTDGLFRWHFDCDEMVYILSGAVEVEHAGQLHALVPGSVALFPVGSTARWRVKGHVRKLFVHRHPTPLARKLVGLS